MVGGAGRLHYAPSLEWQRVGEWDAQRVAYVRLHCPDRTRGPGCELSCPRDPRSRELSVGDDPVDQTESKRVVGIERDVAREQLERARRPDELGEEPSAAVVARE